MSSTRKFRIIGTTTAIIAALALSGCGDGTKGSTDQTETSTDGAGSSSGEPITIRSTDWFTDDLDYEIHEALLTDCATQNGVKIERETIPGSDYMQKLLQMSSSKSLPDLVMIDGPDMPQLAATGALKPLSDFGLSADGKIEGIIEQGTYNDVLYGLQPNTNSLGLIYNKAMLDEAGVEVPKTWDEVLEVAPKLTGDGKYAIAFAAPASYTAPYQFLPFMWSNGGSEATLNDKGTVEALQFWKDLVDKGYASESVVNWDQSDVNEQFMAGNTAMEINGPWQIPVLEASDVDWGIATIPVPKDGDPVVGALGGEVWTVANTGDEAKEEAAAKVLACMDSEENQMRVGKERRTVPTTIALHDEYVKENPEMEPVVDMVLTGKSRAGELGLEWPSAAEKIYTGIQLALVGGKTPQEAMDQVTAQ